MNKREYLRSKGITVGERGRFSPEAQQALDAAVAEGIEFDNVVISKSPAATSLKTKSGKKRVVKVEKTAQQTAIAKGSKTYRDIPEDPDPRYPDGTSYVYFYDGKKIQTSERNACYNCGLSLQYHKCNDPHVVTAHGVQKVTIK